MGRVLVVGAGLAGSLLTWRLAGIGAVQCDLSGAERADATAFSGGIVRGFEPDPVATKLAAESIAELYENDELRNGAGYQQTGSVYLVAEPVRVDEQLTEIERRLPGSAELAGPDEVADTGLGRLPSDTRAVVEQEAGYFSPAQLRDWALDQAGDRIGWLGPVDRMAATDDGPVRVWADGREQAYDVVVVAAGRWTSALLLANGLPSPGVRTRLIQYSVHATPGWRPPVFVDELTGLYGRPLPDDCTLLGIPAEQWDFDPDEPAGDPELPARVRELTADRFGVTVAAEPERVVVAADGYTEPLGLALRAVPGLVGRMYTFAGGSGGAAKTALAASRYASVRINALVNGAGDPGEILQEEL